MLVMQWQEQKVYHILRLQGHMHDRETGGTSRARTEGHEGLMIFQTGIVPLIDFIVFKVRWFFYKQKFK